MPAVFIVFSAVAVTLPASSLSSISILQEDGGQLYYANYATALQALGSLQISGNDYTSAIENLHRARSHLTRLVQQHPNDPTLTKQLAANEELIRRLPWE